MKNLYILPTDKPSSETWKEERLYTEEEVMNIAKLSYNNARVATGNHEVSFNMWFDTWFKNYKK